MAALHSRERLIDALSQAAELEHMLCCSYLYAAMSLKKGPDEFPDRATSEVTRRWLTSMMLIARQEMEHLGMVCNLLSAIGAGPNFSRPNFPQSASHYPLGQPLTLQAFGDPALTRFIEFEAPHWNEANGQPPPTAEGSLIPYDSLQGLYEYIRQGFNTLNAELGAASLFVGPTAAQITNETLFQQTEKAYAVNLRGVLAKDPEKRLAEAKAMIDQIIAEGEGAINDTAGSHYARFKTIKQELDALRNSDPSFEPAYNVALNPRTFTDHGGSDGTLITDPLTLRVAQLFNLVYEAMMLLLIRFYGHTDENPTELAALQEIAFFPLMTMGIRPLGEVLMQLPVGPEHPELAAGPTFELTRPLHFLPHKQAAWVVLHELLAQTGTEATAIAELAKTQSSPQAERLHFIALSMVRNAENFEAYIMGKENI